MAFDAFLKMEGIEGESSDKTHPREIEIESFSWGVTNTGSAGTGGGGGAGKAVSQDFHFTTLLSKASPSLMLACATGRHSQLATLTCRKAGGSGQVEFLKIKLMDVLVSSYQTGGNTGGDDVVPTDQFSLNFAKIDVFYTVAKTGEEIDVTFDFAANRE
jgi:type VI secretion system secreted protein Hcp